jgi:hypothetical protein
VNLAACAKLPRTPENGTWFRCIAPAHLRTALNSAHTKKRSGRFNAGVFLPAHEQFAILSCVDDPLVAQFEVGAVFGSLTPGGHVPHPKLSFVTMNVHVILRDVIDLTEINSAQFPLGTNVQELTGDWRGYEARNHTTPIPEPTGISPTQELGRALFLTRAEGFRAISAKGSCNKTLFVFPDNLRIGSSIAFSEPSGTYSQRIDGYR